MKAATETIFTWTGTDRSGNKIKGEMSGASPALVRARLRLQGANPIQVRKKPKPLLGAGKQKILPKDITLFSRQLATLIASGAPLAQGFNIVIEGTENPQMRALLAEVRADIVAGAPLAESLGKHPRYFDELFRNLIGSGEKSGALEAMLERLAAYKEKSEAIKGKVKKATAYPIAVVVIAFLVTAVLLLYVVPQFEELFANFGAELPVFTRFVLHLSQIFQESWHLIFGGLAVAFVGFMQAMKRSPRFAFGVDRIKLRLPIFGAVFTKAAIARYARTLSTMFAAGVPLVEAMDQVSGAAGNRIYRDAILRVRDDVANGQSLNVAMRRTRRFPNMVTQMIAIGEESGALDHMLGKIADYYEQEVDDAIDGLSTLIEPLIMAILGIILGGLIVAMYLPIFAMGDAI